MKKINIKLYGLYTIGVLSIVLMTADFVSSYYEHKVHEGCDFVQQIDHIKDTQYLLVRCTAEAASELRDGGHYASSKK